MIYKYYLLKFKKQNLNSNNESKTFFFCFNINNEFYIIKYFNLNF